MVPVHVAAVGVHYVFFKHNLLKVRGFYLSSSVTHYARNYCGLQRMFK